MMDNRTFLAVFFVIALLTAMYVFVMPNVKLGVQQRVYTANKCIKCVVGVIKDASPSEYGQHLNYQYQIDSTLFQGSIPAPDQIKRYIHKGDKYLVIYHENYPDHSAICLDSLLDNARLLELCQNKNDTIFRFPFWSWYELRKCRRK